MKSTGVIRRIDELGRIVIPKEIRKNLGIREGDNLEILIENDKLLLQKYSKVSNYQEEIKNIINNISKSFNVNINFYDREKIIYSSNNNFEKINIKKYINDIINERKEMTVELENYNFFCKPVILLSDVIGILVFEINNNINEINKIADFLSNFIINKIDISWNKI